METNGGCGALNTWTAGTSSSSTVTRRNSPTGYGYLLGALQNDGVAVVIATAAHRRAFEGRLTRAGVDLAAAAQAWHLPHPGRG